MKPYPLIGISGSVDKEETRHYVLRDYMRAVLAAGGVPVLLSPETEGEALQACLSRLDGLMLAGGNDVDPALFDAWPVEALGDVDPMRDAFEITLLHLAIERRMPVLGICRGIQMMNIALGGTLWQDLPTQYRTPDGKPPMRHQQAALARYHSHEVAVVEGSLLSQIEGATRFRVNSCHHQAVANIAPPLRLCATAPDGVIEGVEHPDLPFFLGVQWHPERFFDTDPHAAALFEALVRAASKEA